MVNHRQHKVYKDWCYLSGDNMRYTICELRLEGGTEILRESPNFHAIGKKSVAVPRLLDRHLPSWVCAERNNRREKDTTPPQYITFQRTDDLLRMAFSRVFYPG
jgi:hypothetical protein